MAAGFQANPPKAAAVHVGDSVVLREPFVEERVVGLQKAQDTAIFANDAFEKAFCFLAKGLAQVVVEVRE